MRRKHFVAFVLMGAMLCANHATGQKPPSQEPHIGFEYDWKWNFGVLIVRDPLGKPVKKQLTFDTMGQTNGNLIRIDGKDFEFGTDVGKFIEQGSEAQNPSITVWVTNKIKVTQILEVTPGKTGKLDTLLVRYQLENTDTKPHSVGMRVMIDSAIGSPDNDGVPFRYTGAKDLITTFKDFPAGTLPEWAEALEKPDQKDPGTITIMTLKVGRSLEEPQRASITMWPGAVPRDWDIPMESFGPGGAKRDSCLVLYWNPAEIKPGQKRTPGYAYGTQDKPSDQLQTVKGAGDFKDPVDAKKPPAAKSLQFPGGSDAVADALGGSDKQAKQKNSQKAGNPDAKDDSLEKLAKQAARTPVDTSLAPVCCQGDLSVQHAQCALKAALGMIPREPRIDVDNDGKITEKDAHLILQQSIARVRDPQ
jgi:hypothetical protein